MNWARRSSPSRRPPSSRRWRSWPWRRLALGGGHGASLGHLTTAAAGRRHVGGFGLALVSVLWAYDGFGDLSFAGGEVKDPQRNLPRAIILGTLAIIAIYVLTNVAYLYVIPIEAVGRSPLVAADTMMASSAGPASCSSRCSS